MSDEIYRKKSLEKVKSPEKLDDYIRVSNPGMWLLLVSIIALLAGACIWGTFGYVDITRNALVQVDDGQNICTIEEADVSAVQEGMKVKFDGNEAVITKIKTEGKKFVCTLRLDNPVPDGVYEGQVVLRRIQPLAFLTDGKQT